MSGNKPKPYINLLRTVAAVVVCVLIPAILLSRCDGGEDLPRWITWEKKTFSDVSGQYEVILRHKALEVICDTDVIWVTPKDIKVQDAMSCDIDGDGTDELVLLCWKVGRFGTSRPFWVEEDEETWSQHIFVYSYTGDAVKPKWMSSYIGTDVAKMSASDRSDALTGDMTEHGSAVGQQPGSAVTDAAVQHGMPARQHLFLTDTDGRMSSWIWDSWGFTKEDTDISFVVFGDNLIHEPIYQYGLHNNDSNDNDYSNSDDGSSRNKNSGFHFLFENKDIKEAVKASDVAVINQETPLTDQPSRYSDYPRFGTPVGVGEAVSEAGFDVVTCATNHVLDQGVDGVDFMKKFFDSRDIMCIGIQSEDEEEYRPYEVLVRSGIRFALFNYTYGTNGNAVPEDKSYMVHLLDDEEQVRTDIAKARTEADCVLVFAHWGTEYEEQPDEFQQRWTQIFLESNVDVVIGTHPHVLQPYEVLQNDSGHEMLVYYSIGNYISAQSEQSCVKGGMARFTVSLTPDGYKITEYALQPLVIMRLEDGKYMVRFSEDSLEKILPNM